jgi:hydrophobe/amphiphile efflux-3 (HAE3) family protein
VKRFVRRLREESPSELFGRVADTVSARPLTTLAIVGALALAGLALALQLKPSASTDSLVGRSSAASQATERFRNQFGDEAVVVLVRGDLQRTVLTEDVNRLVGLEGCLSGNVPKARLSALPPQCAELASFKPAKVVYGPGTFLNTATEQIQRGFQEKKAELDQRATAAATAARKIAASKGYSKARQEQFAQQASQLAFNQFVSEAMKLALRYGLTTAPALGNPEFISQVVFDASKGVNVPKARFAYLFPSPNSALIQVRLRPGLTDAERDRAINLIRDATKQPMFKLTHGQRYLVSGVPVVVQGLAKEVQRSIFVLLAAALLVMAATLLVVFRTRRGMRLLPLAIALVAAAITYGCLYLAGLDLTMASIAALPVLIGLAVDYAIQMQARFDEARAAGERPATAARAAATSGAPTIAGAALATAAGFLVLLLSPVPMIHGFAILVIVGIVVALACALTAGLATLVRFSAPPSRPEDLPPVMPRARSAIARLRGWLAQGPVAPVFTSPIAAAGAVVVILVAVAVAVSAGTLVAAIAGGVALVAAALLALMSDARDTLAAEARVRARHVLNFAIAEPRKVLMVGLAVAALGWVAETQTRVESDVTKLVPQDLPALKDAQTLQDETGVSGEIDVTVTGQDLTDPAAIAWMTNFQQRVLKAHGYQTGETCRQKKNPPEVCPALSLTDLFRSVAGSQQNAQALLAAVPPYFSQAVISSDRKTANLAFGIRLMPLERQKRVVDSIRSEIDPPAGIQAEVAGLPVLAAEANGKLSSEWRRALTLVLGLAAVFLVLLAIRREVERAAIPLIPIALATGWSALVLFLLRIPLNPMSATLGALVIAISTEFSVLLSARYREERDAGANPQRALELTYSSTGAAVLASGATAIAGFAALMASDIRMLSDFGKVTVVDLTVSLLGVMVVLPAALAWAEQHGRFTAADFDPRRALAASVRGLRSLKLPRPALGTVRRSATADAGAGPATAGSARPARRRPRLRRRRPRA